MSQSTFDNISSSNKWDEWFEAMDYTDSNLKEFLEYAQKTDNIELNAEAYKDWATKANQLYKDTKKSNDNLKEGVNENTNSIFGNILTGLKDTGDNVNTTNKGIKDSVASTASWCKANPITITTNHVDTYTTVGSPSSGGDGGSSSGGGNSGGGKSSGGNKSGSNGKKVNTSKSGTTGNVTLDAQLRATDAGQRARNSSPAKVYKPELKVTWSKYASRRSRCQTNQ